ncbi:MAG: vitamin B12-dependent ribonucleotide reductase [Thermodesulfobacteriota bacterium]
MSEPMRFVRRTPNDAVENSEPPADKGLRFDRVFSAPGQDPLGEIAWDSRTCAIHNDKGDVIFEQHGVEAPTFWSDMAVNVVASRYFRGKPGSSERESSVRNLLLRVVQTIGLWGRDQEYFASEDDAQAFQDELLALLVHQKASFNSPVWFNVGIDETPQCSACFILSVDDTMESILQWYSEEGMIFKGGSGSGVNLSRLRSSREPLSGGGTASGPISFMKAADASAGVIKSGGKTRRAAKMVILNMDHPDVLEFIRCKAQEEKKAHALIRAGFDPVSPAGAYATVAFQNSNHSVRLSDEFMEADQADASWQTRFILNREPADTYRSRDLLREIAKAAHVCGDPGIQFHTTTNLWHTCPHSGPIRASNPCSEYVHIDDSACNLASLRLTGFFDDQGFKLDEFCHAVDVLITAQEILVDKASYPSLRITQNSKSMRALGLGFADLGAMLMALGLPYDSDEGRAWASTVSALMTGRAYLQSAKLARVKGAFAEFEKNREPMLHVIAMHRDRTRAGNPTGVPGDLVREATDTWEEALELGRDSGFRNCQVTVIAPTGTVGFMMDCDTTGVEPEVALVRYKSLSGGGRLRLVNRTVAHALHRLGYAAESAKDIIREIEQTGTAEGVNGVLPEHLPVFDCAFRPLKGKRCISPEGHLRMMAAIQPFISGAISKTVNLPKETTVEQIEENIRYAWKLGLKAVTFYRDGSKAVQPLDLGDAPGQDRHEPVRRRLPTDCKTVRHKFEVAGQKGYIHTGFYEDGQVGEIFIRMSKEGSTISGLMDTIATLTSIALQYGVPLEALVNKFSHVRFEPSGFTSNPEVPIAKSLTDYIFRYLGHRFLTKEQQIAAGLVVEEHSASSHDLDKTRGAHSEPLGKTTSVNGHTFHPQSDAPACQECGAIMMRNGSCYKCLNCGATNGCS